MSMDHEYKKYSQMFQKVARVKTTNYNQNCCMEPGIENLNDYPTKYHSEQHTNDYPIYVYITNKEK